MKVNLELTNKEMDIVFRHFDRSEASGEIFENARFNFSFKDFSTTLEMTTNSSKTTQNI